MNLLPAAPAKSGRRATPLSLASANALLATTLLLLTPLASANLITNGGFDVAVPTIGTGGGWTATSNDFNGGWRASGGNLGGYFIINDNGAGASGAADPSIEQLLTGLTIGETYVVTGDFTNRYGCCGVGTPSGNAALSFGVDITPGGLLTQLAYPGTYPTWFSFSTSFTATQSSHTVRFSAERNGSDIEYAIDNISVVARTVPEPTSLALAGLALVGLAGLRRRQATR